MSDVRPPLVHAPLWRSLLLAAVLALGVAGCTLLSTSADPVVPGPPVAMGSGGDHVVDLAHGVPTDYLYRTERTWPPVAAGASPVVAAVPGEAGALTARCRDLAAALVTGAELDEEQRVLVTTFVTLDDLYRSSGLGRLLQEEVLTGLQQRGVAVVDGRKTPAVLVRRQNGEFGLSRDVDQLPYVHDAYATVVGTYRRAGDQVFVNARLVRNRDDQVLAATGMVLEVSPLVAALLADERAVPARRPVAVKIQREAGS